MALEPASKRRRQGPSPWDLIAEEGKEEEEEENDEDNDEDESEDEDESDGEDNVDDDGDDESEEELDPQSLEALAKCDPDYKISVERAYSDQRFQATMEHIFDKYGRDFEGVGDEIDLMTGEIVVNNGHVRNMRDEGDVGCPPIQDYSTYDEDDEGFLLEDLIDDDDDDDFDGPISEEGEDDARKHDGEDQDIEKEGGREGKEDSRIAQRQLVSAGPGSGSSLSGVIVGRKNTITGPFSDASTSSMMFGASSYTPRPAGFPAAPWDLPHNFLEPSREYHSNAFGRPPPIPDFKKKVDRYRFPVQAGHSSIWAPRSRFREDDEPARPSFTTALSSLLARGRDSPYQATLLPKKTSKTRKQILPPLVQTRSSDDAADEDEADEDAILTGRKSGAQAQPEAKVIGGSDDRDDYEDEDEDEDEILRPGVHASGVKSTKPYGFETDLAQNIDMGATIQLAAPTRKRKRYLEPLDEGFELYKEDKAQENSADGDRGDLCELRRSGRARKQVEFLNKISWAEALAKTKVSHTMEVVLPAVDSTSRAEYQRIGNMLEKESRKINPADQHISAAIDKQKSPLPGSAAVIPDLHDSLIPQDQASRKNVVSQIRDQTAALYNIDYESACILSDDESPIIISKPKSTQAINELPPTHAEERSEDKNMKFQKSGAISNQADGGNQVERTEVPSSSQQSDCIEIGTMLQNNENEIVPESRVANLLNSSPTKPRSRGRPRKSNIDLTQPISTDIAMEPQQYMADSLDAPSCTTKPRPRGRPRKSNIDPTQFFSIETATGADQNRPGSLEADNSRSISRPRGRPRKSIVIDPTQPTSVEAAIEPPQTLPDSQDSLGSLNKPRSRGRPRKSDIDSTQSISDDDHQYLPDSHDEFSSPSNPRPRGRPQKSSTPPTAIEVVIEPPQTLPDSQEDRSSVAIPSSSPTRSLVRFTSQVSLEDKPHRLVNELKWLRRRQDAASALSGFMGQSDQDSDSEKTLRKRLSEARLKKMADAIEEFGPSQQHTVEAAAALDDDELISNYSAEEHQNQMLPSPRRSSSPPLEQTATLEQSPTNMNTSNTQHTQTLPTSTSASTSTTTSTSPSLSPSPSSSPSPSASPSISIPTVFVKQPHTPRRASRHTHRKTPSSRRSILSLISDDDNRDMDELGRSFAALPHLHSSGAPITARRIWRSSVLTTEVYRTPVKKSFLEPISPGSMIKTPGGTVKACGLNGFRCGRDFCFACL